MDVMCTHCYEQAKRDFIRDYLYRHLSALAYWRTYLKTKST